MTTIRLHGILAQKYGEVFKMDISKPRDVIRAIDANRDGFRKTVMDLQKEGFSYEILVNKKRLNKESFLNSKKAQEIDLVPFIVGAGTELLVALKVGSSVIQASMKSLPQTAEALDGMVHDPFVSEGNNPNAVEIADSRPLS